MLNRVVAAAGLFVKPWARSIQRLNGENFEEVVEQAEAAYRRKHEEGHFDDDDTDQVIIRSIAAEDDTDYKPPTITLYRIEKHGKLVHISRTKEAALREIAWRDWILGCDGVKIVEMTREGMTMYGMTHHPHRYGSPWPKAKLEEFKRLYQSDMSMRELEEYFDTSISSLGKKRAQLGLPPRYD